MLTGASIKVIVTEATLELSEVVVGAGTVNGTVPNGAAVPMVLSSGHVIIGGS